MNLAKPDNARMFLLLVLLASTGVAVIAFAASAVTKPGPGDVVLPLVAGIAATVAFCSGMFLWVGGRR